MIPIIEFFILGFLFAVIGLPLADGIGTIINFVTELVKAKISVKISEYNSQIVDDVSSANEVHMPQIGFQIPSEGDYIEDDKKNS